MLSRDLSAVRRLRHLQIIDRLDYLRALRRLAIDVTQSDLARALGLTQPSISSALKSAGKIADPRPGFSGASPYEIAQRYTAGRLSREQLIDELGRWADEPDQATGRSAGERSAPSGSCMMELRKALGDGLLDDDTFRAVLERRQQADRPSCQPAG